MATVSVWFVGADLEDVFVYRSTLYAWTLDQRLRMYSIQALESAIVRADPDRGQAVCYWLFHQGGLGASLIQQQARDDHHFESPYSVKLDLSSLRYREVRIQADPGSVLDMVAYYDTLYLASDGGMFVAKTAELDADSDSVQPERPISASCVAASAGLGAIAASCGAQGLHIIFDSFASPAKPSRRVSDVSVRAEVGAGSVVNHRSRSDLEFLHATTHKTTAARGIVLTDVQEGSVEPVSGTSDAVVDNDQVGFTLWDRQRLVVFSPDGVSSVGVKAENRSRRLTTTRRLGPAPQSYVISACRVGNSFFVESPTGIMALPPDSEGVPLSTGPVIGLRSYQRSMRYQRLATATAETGLWLLGMTPSLDQEF
jgi:hypothetical protein